MAVPAMSIVVPTYTNDHGLKRLITSLQFQSVQNFELIIVDNGANYDVGKIVRILAPTFNVRILLLARNQFLAAALRIGSVNATGRILGVVNDDVYLTETWVQNVLATFERHPQIGQLASLIHRTSDPLIIDSAGNHLCADGMATNLQHGQQSSRVVEPSEVFGPSSACAAFRRSAVQEVGNYDSAFSAYYEDIDLSFRLQLAGYSCLMDPTCRAFHERGGTFKSDFTKSFLMERNSTWTLAKNMPGSLLRKYYRDIIRVTMSPLPRGTSTSRLGWIAGKAAASGRFFSLLSERREVQGPAKSEIDRIETLLNSKTIGECIL